MSECLERPHWLRLLHRWFVEYNPLYLVSAALVLVGVNALSGELVQRGFLLGQVGVPLIAEVYGWALIGGAALLVRIGLRRPAVMLALLATFYLCDLTMHTETCVYLGWVGPLAAGLWWLSFVGKLVALGRALQLRLPRAVLCGASLSAVGLAVVPRVLGALDARAGGAVVAVWVFAVFAFALFGWRDPTSTVPLDAWGHTVLRRALRATWAMWATLMLLHVLYWCSDRGIRPYVLVPVAPLLATRWFRREAWVWAAIVASLVFTVVVLPAHAWVAALLAAAALLLHALRRPTRAPSRGAHARSGPHRSVESRAPASRGPYRSTESWAPAAARAPVTFGLASRPALDRFVTGSIGATYLSLWTLGWTGGSWPAHVFSLDVGLAFAVVAAAWALRRRWPLATVAAPYLHYAVVAHLLRPPKGTLEWSIVSVSAGFVLLVACLAVSYRSRHARGACPPPEPARRSPVPPPGGSAIETGA